MRAAGPLVAIGTALLLAACGGSDDSDPDLLLVSTRDGDYAIYAMSSSGGDQKRLTDADVDPSTPEGLLFQTEPAWSPDGSTIAFVSKRSGTFDLYAMNADGSGTQPLTSTKDDDGQPDWSPDGKRIVFARGTPGRLFVMGADGAGARRITEEEVDETEPAWSPDGRLIAYVAEGPRLEHPRALARAARRLAAAPADEAQRRGSGAVVVAGWAANRLLRGCRRKSLRHLHRGRRRKGRATRHLGRGRVRARLVPDGKTIAFSEAGAIVAIDVETGEERTLTDAENNDSSPTWKPEQGGEQ